MCRLEAPERLIGDICLGLGWLAVAQAGLVLIVASGPSAPSATRRWPNPASDICDFHEVFHTIVCAAVACRYLAIAIFVR